MTAFFSLLSFELVKMQISWNRSLMRLQHAVLLWKQNVIPAISDSSVLFCCCSIASFTIFCESFMRIVREIQWIYRNLIGSDPFINAYACFLCIQIPKYWSRLFSVSFAFWLGVRWFGTHFVLITHKRFNNKKDTKMFFIKYYTFSGQISL